MISPRPTRDQMTTYEAAWAEFLERDTPEADLVRGLARSGGAAATFVRDQFVAACFLEDLLVRMEAPQEFRKNACFDFGRACAMRPEVWAVFDKFYARCRKAMKDVTQNKEWAGTPIPQEVPAPTRLLDAWYDHARRSVGKDGVYPQPFFHVDPPDGGLHIEALAVNGNQAFARAVQVCKESTPTEFVLGVDLFAVPGQSIEFNDFLAVVWYVGGQFYTGVIDYQKLKDVPDGEVAAFRPIRWDNNYWNHCLREYPLPAMIAALAGLDEPPPSPEGT